MKKYTNEEAKEKRRFGITMSNETAKKLIYGTMLLALFAFSLYIRAVLPYPSELLPEDDSYKFAQDDSVYQIRFVELTVRYFPNRPMYDPFTFFPYGHIIHFGPMFSQLMAFFSIIFSFGSPDRYFIHTVALFFAPVLGALIVFPIYSIAKEVFDRRAGILAAMLIATQSGQFLSRSRMGFTDNEVAQMFFIVTTIALWIIALKKSRGVTIDDFLKRNWKAIKRPIAYSVLAGISFGMYVTSWVGGIMLILPIMLFTIIQNVLDHMRGRPTAYLSVVGIISCLIPAFMVLPYANSATGLGGSVYSMLHPIILLFTVVVFAFLAGVSILAKKKNVPRLFYPFIIFAFILLGMVVFGLFAPSVFSPILSLFTVLNAPTGGGLTVAEKQPLGIEKFGALFGMLPSVLFLVSLPLILIYKILVRDLIKKEEWNPGAMLVFIWSFLIILMTLAQNRFAYYLSLNVAVCASYAGVLALDVSGFRSLLEKYRGKVEDMEDFRRFLTKNGTLMLFVAFMVAIIFIFGMLDGTSLGVSTQGGLTGNLDTVWYQSHGGVVGGDGMEWLYAMKWMKNNTPDPQDDKVLNYTKFYVRPADYIYGNLASAFKYPKCYQGERPICDPNGTRWYDYEKAYGVMSWWDYGHVITYFGHRIPNANPFQAGIGVLACPERDPYMCTHGTAEEVGNRSLIPGAAPFFVETSEEKANVILDALGTRYIMTDWQMASGKFYAMATWAHNGNMSYVNGQYYVVVRTESSPQQNPSNYYYYTMEAKLHFFDGSSFENAIPALKHYRLIYESSTCYVSSSCSLGTIAGRDMKFIKTYEYLLGANITGNATPLSSVSLFLPLTTNQGRNFNYTQTVTSSANGTYAFTVPYSNEVPQDNWPSLGKTNFAVLPTAPYIISSGNVTKMVSLTEDQVLYGGNVTLDLV